MEKRERTFELKAWMVVALLGGALLWAIAQEEIILTTYYPSPRGVYHELRTAGDVRMGDIEPFRQPGFVDPNNPDHHAPRLHVIRQNEPIWAVPAFRVDDVPHNGLNYDPTPFLIDQTGNVGIGTTAPTAKLHVAGTAGTDGIRLPDGTLQTSAEAHIERFGFEYLDANQVAVTRTGRDSAGNAAIKVEIGGILRKKTDGDLILSMPGSLRSGESESSNTWYYAYLYWDGSAIQGRLSSTAPDATGYHPSQPNWRWVGEVRNDGSDFATFLRLGNTVFRGVYNLLYNAYSSSFTTIDASAYAPRTSRILLATSSSRQGSTNATAQTVEIRPSDKPSLVYRLQAIIDSGNVGSSGDEFSGDGVHIALDSLQRFDWRRTGGNPGVVVWQMNAYAYVITAGN